MEVGWLHLVPLLPLLGAIFNGLAGRWVPKSWVYTVALLAILCSFLLGMAAFLQVAGEGGESAQIHETVYTWFAVGNLHVDVALALDRLSGTLVLVITGVGFLIHLYSVGYIDEDPGYWRYFAYLNLFVAAMLLLVLGDNLVAMIVGWEGVGLCSYLLIGFWFDDDQKAYAGRKAFVVNRIGDFGFLIGIFILFGATGHVDFAGIRATPLPYTIAMWAAGLLFLGATGKSAQLPLYIWLPDAMAGPTPVSALIHAATMVTAGVYMIARLSFLYV
ncbi:MAG: proton-conducting transporter membrane subunit, partial [Myxococcales bacterium]